MTDKIVSLRPATGPNAPVDPGFVAFLEGLVTEAKAGKLRALAYAAVTNERVSWRAAGSCKLSDMLMGVSLLQQAFLIDALADSAVER